MNDVAHPATPELTAEDIQHLTWLSWGHYAIAALTALFGCFPLIHLGVGVGMLTGQMGDAPAGMGLLFIAIATVIIGLFWSVAGVTAYAGKCLAERRRRTLVFVVAIIQAVLFQPFGTVLGILSILVLQRDSVKAAFDAPVGAPAPRPVAF